MLVSPRISVIAALAIGGAVISMASAGSYARSGALDKSFSRDGKTVTGFGKRSLSDAYDVAVQPDANCARRRLV